MPLYDSLGEDAIEYIIGHSESTIVFTQVWCLLCGRWGAWWWWVWGGE